jgi:hypothetical protein
LPPDGGRRGPDSGLAFGEPEDGGGGSLFFPQAESRTTATRKLRMGERIVPRLLEDCDPVGAGGAMIRGPAER